MFSVWIYLESVVSCRRKVIVSYCKTGLCMFTHIRCIDGVT
jgi:hypothetical protein